MADSANRLCFDLDCNPFFCDGPAYLIMSRSLGGMSVEEFCQAHYRGNERDRKALVRQGIYLPLLFDGDCILDDALIVFGELTPEEASQAIKAFTWKLNIPCGQLLICCEGQDDEEIRNAVQNVRREYLALFEIFDVPPGEYLVEIYATPPRFILHFSPLTEQPPMPEMEYGCFELPTLGDFFDCEEEA